MNPSLMEKQNFNGLMFLIVRSPLLRTMETLVFSPFLVTGAAIERQWLSIIFFQEFLNDPTSLATKINIQLQSQFIQVGLHK